MFFGCINNHISFVLIPSKQYYTLQVQQLCTVAKARMVVAVTALCVGLYVSFHLVTMNEILHPIHGYRCIPYPQYRKAGTIWSYVYLFLYCAVPVLSLFILNGLIVYKLRTAMETRAR